MRIGVLGAGGAGGYFGGRWAQAGHDVTLVARGAHLEAIRSAGLTIEGDGGIERVEVRAVGAVAELGALDAVVVATKSWQLQDAAEPLRGIDGSPPVFGLQNGVESAGVLSRIVGRSHVLGGTCRVLSYIVAPGHLRNEGVDPVIHLGELDGGGSDRTARLERELDLGPALRVVGSSAIQVEIWRKFLFFAPVSGVGSITRRPIGEFRVSDRSMLEAAVREVDAVARARDIALGGRAVDEALAFIDALPAEGTSSMQRDFEAGRRTELEALAGAVVRLGAERGIATPVHREIYETLLPLEHAARERS